MVFVGRTLAYRSNSWRNVTLTERYPPPTGVVSGPLRQSFVRRMLSSVALGSGVPALSTAVMPPYCSSQSNRIPNASSTWSVAAVISGPIPSPGIRVAARVTAAPESCS